MQQFKEGGVSFVIHLGDIVDGKQRMMALKDAGGHIVPLNAATPSDIESEAGQAAAKASAAALQSAMDIFAAFSGPTYHVVGNHCLYNYTRPQLYERCAAAPAFPHVTMVCQLDH